MLFVPGTKEPIKWRGIFFSKELKEHLSALRLADETELPARK